MGIKLDLNFLKQDITLGLTLYNVATTLPCWILPSLSICAPPLNTPNCLTPDCPDLVESQLHPREIKALKEFSSFDISIFKRYFSEISKNQEYLRLRKDDPREKSLFLSANYSFNEDLDPKYLSEFINILDKKFDTKYTVIKTYDDICHEISEAAKTGKLANVILQGHSDQNGMLIDGTTVQTEHGWYASESAKLDRSKEFLNCFKGLHTSGKIILLGGYMGAPKKGNPKNNIAQKMATLAQRTVIAAIDMTYAGYTKIIDALDAEIFHPSGFIWKTKNIFKVFHPIYENCINVFKDKIHQREQLAIETIKNETLQKSTLLQSTEFEDLQDILRLCKDDPRQKFLFLSMESDAEGQYALSPERNPEFFETLSKNYDFKFKVIKSYDELCQEIREASKMGKLLNLVIDGHGNPNSIHISGEKTWNNYLHKNRDLAKCFNSLDPSSKITLLACETGKPQNGNPNDNIAGDIAKNAKLILFAPNEKTKAIDTKITSIEPFEISHPSKMNPNENIFKKFNP